MTSKLDYVPDTDDVIKFLVEETNKLKSNSVRFIAQPKPKKFRKKIEVKRKHKSVSSKIRSKYFFSKIFPKRRRKC